MGERDSRLLSCGGKRALWTKAKTTLNNTLYAAPVGEPTATWSSTDDHLGGMRLRRGKRQAGKGTGQADTEGVHDTSWVHSGHGS